MERRIVISSEFKVESRPDVKKKHEQSFGNSQIEYSRSYDKFKPRYGSSLMSSLTASSRSISAG